MRRHSACLLFAIKTESARKKKLPVVGCLLSGLLQQWDIFLAYVWQWCSLQIRCFASVANYVQVFTLRRTTDTKLYFRSTLSRRYNADSRESHVELIQPVCLGRFYSANVASLRKYLALG